MISFSQLGIDLSTLIAGGLIGVGVVIAKIIEAKGNTRRDDEDQIFKQLRVMNNDLLVRVQGLETSLKVAIKEIATLKGKNELCLEEHKKSQEEILNLRAEVARLQQSSDNRSKRL